MCAINRICGEISVPLWKSSVLHTLTKFQAIVFDKFQTELETVGGITIACNVTWTTDYSLRDDEDMVVHINELTSTSRCSDNGLCSERQYSEFSLTLNGITGTPNDIFRKTLLWNALFWIALIWKLEKNCSDRHTVTPKALFWKCVLELCLNLLDTKEVRLARFLKQIPGTHWMMWVVP